MNTEIENILRDYNYSELNAEQLAAVNEWASSEAEYTTMRQIITSAPLLNEDVAPSPRLKTSLMETFSAAHAVTPVTTVSKQQSNKKGLYLWIRGAAAIAAILLVIFMVYPLFQSDSNELVADNTEKSNSKKSKQTTNSDELKSDTVQLEEIEGVTQSPNQLAENSIQAPVPNRVDEIESPQRPSEVRRVAAPRPIPNPFLNMAGADSGISEDRLEGSAPEEIQAEIIPLHYDHSDRISVADLPKRSRQIMQEQPELLDLLHASF